MSVAKVGLTAYDGGKLLKERRVSRVNNSVEGEHQPARALLLLYDTTAPVPLPGDVAAGYCSDVGVDVAILGSRKSDCKAFR